MLLAEPVDDFLKPIAALTKRGKHVVVFDGVMQRQHLTLTAAKVAEQPVVVGHLHGGNRVYERRRTLLAGFDLLHHPAHLVDLLEVMSVDQSQTFAEPPLRRRDALDFGSLRTRRVIEESDRRARLFAGHTVSSPRSVID